MCGRVLSCRQGNPLKEPMPSLDKRAGSKRRTSRPSGVTTATLPPAAVGPDTGVSGTLHSSSPVLIWRALSLRGVLQAAAGCRMSAGDNASGRRMGNASAAAVGT